MGEYPHYPICDVVPRIKDALTMHGRVVVTAQTGSGKTTLLPPMLHDLPCLNGKKIVMLEPRRLAAKMAAWRIADLMETPIGEKVGYRVRNETYVSTHTQIEVVTEGILTRQIQEDPELSEIGLIIFDEFHERSIHADLALALVLDVCENLRSDLKLMVMSATLDTDALCAMLGNPPNVNCDGRLFPVELHYLGAPERDYHALNRKMIQGISRASRETEGDILVFLPGYKEILSIADDLKSIENFVSFKIHLLHSSLTKSEQEAAVKPSLQSRKIILSSAIAESSLTIEGVTAVVDSCLERTTSFFAGTGMNRLVTQRASQASLTQRAGRAGRLCEGKCYRAIDENMWSMLSIQNVPEILRNDLAPMVLELAQWGVASTPESLQWLDIPPMAHYQIAYQLLQELDAIDPQGKMTSLGRQMNAQPLHPRLSHMVLSTQTASQRAVACELSAILTEVDCMRRMKEMSCADIRVRMDLLRGTGEMSAVDRSKLKITRDSAIMIKKAFKLSHSFEKYSDEEIAHALFLGFPDRIAKRRANSKNTYFLSNGRAVNFEQVDILQNDEYLLIPVYDDQAVQGKIRLAFPITLEEIYHYMKGHIRTSIEMTWDEVQNKLISQKVEKIGELILSSKPLKTPPIEEAFPFFVAQLEKKGLSMIPAFEKVALFRDRINTLHQSALYQSLYPCLSDEHLIAHAMDWLPDLLEGKNAFTQIQPQALLHALQSLLSSSALMQLDQLAPTSIQVPSGSKVQIQYTPHGPRISVRLQELFGWFDAPKIAQNTIPITIEMLSPGMRQVQVTQDLRNFWKEGYFFVRKDLRGRYPKHYWPEDPLDAEAIRGSMQRRKKD